ncbi:DMT family transporter [Marinovum sp.]|uniref:DMT family transporter n=1 Tax=Marinovum sp. TaxID=2024839 RepID=UPI003A940E3C
MSSALPQTRPLAAAASMLGAMAVIGVIDNFVPTLAEEIGLWQFYLARLVLALPLVVLAARLGFGTVVPRRPWAVALRGALLAVSMMFYFGALSLMPIAQALSGLFTSPVFVLVITALALRQPIGPWRILAVSMGFTGILVVLSPDPTSLSIATFLPVLGGLFYALGAIATRTVCAGEDILAMLLAMFLAQGVIGVTGLTALAVLQPEVAEGAAGFVARGWVWPLSPLALWLLLIQSVFSVLGVGLLTRAYALGDASYVAVFEYSVFIFGPLAGFALYGHRVGWNEVAGIALIAAAGLVIVWRLRDG